MAGRIAVLYVREGICPNKASNGLIACNVSGCVGIPDLGIVDFCGFVAISDESSDVTIAGYITTRVALNDKPGVIGSLGTVCGKHHINICTMGVGQKPAEQKAMLAVSLDKEPDASVVEELGRLDFVNEIYVCKLS